MSLKALAFAWDFVAEGPIQKFVLVALADQAQDCGHLWPSVAAIAERMGIADPRTIRRHITTLVEAGIVKRIENFARQGRQTANVYEIVGLPNPKPCSDLCRLGGAEMSVQREGEGGLKRQARGGTEMSGSSLMNRKKEPKKKKKKIAEIYVAPVAWARPLGDHQLVHQDQPSSEWLLDVQGERSDAHMEEQAKLFVDWYNSPATRDLKAWKTAFRTWIQRSVEQIDSSDPRATVMHDPSLPKGKCKCKMCKRRALTG